MPTRSVSWPLGFNLNVRLQEVDWEQYDLPHKQVGERTCRGTIAAYVIIMHIMHGQ